MRDESANPVIFIFGFSYACVCVCVRLKLLKMYVRAWRVLFYARCARLMTYVRNICKHTQ